MEPTPRPSTAKPNEEDIDLGHLFYKTGGAINHFFYLLGRMFEKIAEAILHLLFFLRRNLIWLIIGTAIGMGYGIYRLYKEGVRYTSSMTVRANFNSTRNLYGTVNMFNALIGNSRSDELARILGISRAEAASLSGFEINPVISEMMTADMYKNTFLKTVRASKMKLDTFWVATIKYEDFKSSLTKYDYPFQQITAFSTNPGIFAKIQNGFINQVSSNSFLQEARQSSVETNRQVVDMLTNSIQGLDTLRSTYNRRLATLPANGQASSTVAMIEGNVINHTPELELYDKLLELKDELKTAKTDAVVEDNIVQVYSGFGTMGQKDKFYNQQVVSYALFGFLCTLIIFLIVALYSYLNNLEKKYADRQVAGKL